MRDFIEDGYEYIYKRNDNDYVLSKDKAGTYQYDLPKNWAEAIYSFDQASEYWDKNEDKRIDLSPPAPTPEDLLREELRDLLEWFVWYDEQVMRHLRDTRAGRTSEIDIVTLDAQADIKAERIKEIREILDPTNAL